MLQIYSQNNAEYARKRHKCTCEVLTQEHACFLFVYAHICGQIFTNNFLVVHYSIMSVRLKFQKDQICWYRVAKKLFLSGILIFN